MHAAPGVIMGCGGKTRGGRKGPLPVVCLFALSLVHLLAPLPISLPPSWVVDVVDAWGIDVAASMWWTRGVSTWPCRCGPCRRGGAAPVGCAARTHIPQPRGGTGL